MSAAPNRFMQASASSSGSEDTQGPGACRALGWVRAGASRAARLLALGLS
jgi:hypothetical protein